MYPEKPTEPPVGTCYAFSGKLAYSDPATARANLMSDDHLHDMNPEQRQAVRHVDGPLLVLAGAGSGKTRVITRKIAYLIRDCGMKPRHIAAVTFTNKAAREMRERVGALLGKDEARGLKISTFHTLGLDLIRRDPAVAGRRKGFSIYDARDSLRLIQHTAGDVDADVAGRLQQRISRWKNAGLPAARAVAEAEDELEMRTAQAYVAYERQLSAYNAVDFDDLIALPLAALERDEALRERWQNRIHHLMVDEYQDTNACQYRLVRQLIGVRAALTAVGDDDQSIYAWRGAQPDNLRLLAEDFPRLKVIKLERNYRSSQRILTAANRLIANNPHLFEKKLWSGHGPGDFIRVVACNTSDHETERLVGDLLHHRFSHAARWGDYAILFRSNHQSRGIEKALREHRIPYRLAGGNSFFDFAEVKDLLAYLRLMTNPTDDAAFLRVVNTPKREIGAATLEKLAGYCAERQIPLLQGCTEMGLAAVMDTRHRDKLHMFADWITRTAEEASGEDDPMPVIRGLADRLRGEDWLGEVSGEAKAAERRVANLTELLDWLTRMGADEPLPLSERVARITLQTFLDPAQDETEADAVHLLTLHASKGLEWPHVFLIGLEDDVLPHKNSVDEGQLEEERRLLYVGITRAQRSLTLSYAKRRRRFGEWESCTPSRFLAELPDDVLEWHGVDHKVPEGERKDRGRAQLANLKAMLGT